MTIRYSHLQRSAELLRSILSGSTPADKHLDVFFRAHREMGSHDRGYVAEAVYGCLRNKRVLEYVCGASSSAEDLVAAYQMIYGGLTPNEVLQLDGREAVRALIQTISAVDLDNLPAAVRSNFPDVLWDQLCTQLGEAPALELALALNQPAPVDLRVNTLKATRELVQAELQRNGYACAATPYSSSGLRRNERKSLFATDAFKYGWFEIQDEGSQLLSLLVDPQPRERVMDFCAGGGGKALHLSALMKNTGTLYAFDTHAKRLEKMKPRLRRAGLDNVRTQAITSERDPHVKRLRGSFDRVLVDAPCSGTGTLRRNPDIKWRPFELDVLVTQQANILTAAAALVKPGGRLVYATCSVLQVENENVVESFLTAHPQFSRIPVNEVLAHLNIPLEMPGLDLRLYPHLHGTDGFYAAVLVKSV